MAVARLVPSTNDVSSTYLTVASASNMYTNTDSTTSGTVTNTRSGTSSYYFYLRGFNFDTVPSNAIVSNISIKLKASQTGGNTSTIYCYDGSTQVSGCGTGTALTNSATTQTFTNTTVDWDTLKGYGSDFGIRINCRRASRNTQAVITVYGAEIEVTYTVPTPYTISATGDGTLAPSGSTTVYSGDSYNLFISGLSAKPTVTDNNVDVTSQVVELQSGTSTLIPTSYTSNSGFSLSNISNAYADATSTNYAQLELNGGTTGNISFAVGGAVIPSTATISSVSCSFTYQYNRNNSSSGYTGSCQMYAGSTAKGSSYSLVSAGGTDVAKTTVTLSVGSWSASDIANANLHITCTNNASSTHRFLYVYGLSFTVVYTLSGKVYTYTISNVSGNHTIVVTASAPSGTGVYIKLNNTWTEAQAIFKKVNGSWVEQASLSPSDLSGTLVYKGSV